MRFLEILKISGPAERCTLGIIALAALTYLCLRLQLSISTAGFLYLIVIVVLSLTGDLVSSIVTSLLAAMCLSYFFAPPLFSVAFLTTSLLISRLVSEVRWKSEDALSSVNRKLVDAEQRASNRIARDLHDDVGQRLAILAIELDQVQHDPPDSVSELRRRMRGLHEQTVQIATDVQAISHELHSSSLPYLGIAAAMRGFCREFGQRQNVEIDFKGDDVTTPLPPEISLCLFRVLQEALRNAARHSGAREFEVQFFAAAGGLHLGVCDSGVGFDRKAAMKGPGLGLTSMQERMKLVRGELSIDSQPGRGTTIHAWVPLSAKNNSLRAAG